MCEKSSRIRRACHTIMEHCEWQYMFVLWLRSLLPFVEPRTRQGAMYSVQSLKTSLERDENVAHRLVVFLVGGQCIT